jgi:uncharacterized membrane protein
VEVFSGDHNPLKSDQQQTFFSRMVKTSVLVLTGILLGIIITFAIITLPSLLKQQADDNVTPSPKTKVATKSKRSKQRDKSESKGK